MKTQTPGRSPPPTPRLVLLAVVVLAFFGGAVVAGAMLVRPFGRGRRYRARGTRTGPNVKLTDVAG